MTLLALRLAAGELRPIAVGSYFSTERGAAEVAFAVDDHFQGKGLGTMLLDRLATIAGAHGFKRFEAVTLTENSAMLEVFHESGFEIRSKSERGCVNVQLSIDPTGASVNAAERRDAFATAASLRPLFEPRAVAVVGASRTPGSVLTGRASTAATAARNRPSTKARSLTPSGKVPQSNDRQAHHHPVCALGRPDAAAHVGDLPPRRTV